MISVEERPCDIFPIISISGREMNASGTKPNVDRPPQPISSISTANNFGLLRLLAALQVVCYHGVVMLQIPHQSGWPGWVLKSGALSPGVPVFFCISGFLIAQSVEKNRQKLWRYFEARALRIYPGLVLVTCCGAVMLFLLGLFKGVPMWKSAVWFLSTAVAGSTINPEFIRPFGIGVWNGSLWTIPVELSFYLFLPAAYIAFGSKGREMDWCLVLLLALSFGLFIACDGLIFGETKSVGLASKVVWFSLPGNLWMFLFGTLAYRHFSKLRRLVEDKFVFWLLLIVLAASLPYTDWPFWALGSRIFCLRFLLAGATIAAAFSWAGKPARLLCRQDYSYGLYLYHAPILNLFLYLGCGGDTRYFAIALGLSLVTASMSWILVEKRALALKGRFFPAVAGQLAKYRNIRWRPAPET